MIPFASFLCVSKNFWNSAPKSPQDVIDVSTVSPIIATEMNRNTFELETGNINVDSAVIENINPFTFINCKIIAVINVLELSDLSSVFFAGLSATVLYAKYIKYATPINFITGSMEGMYSNRSVVKTAHMDSTMVKPVAAPNAKTSALFSPCFTDVDMDIILFGPGVKQDTNK